MTGNTALLEQSEKSLEINTSFFEQYRAKCLKAVLVRLLKAELRSHCRAVEELSASLQTVLSLEIS